MIPVVWYNGQSSWCHTIVRFFTNQVFFQHFSRRETLPEREVVVVVIKADEADIDELNVDLLRYPAVLLMVCSNEEGKFDRNKILHPRFKTWLQTPHPTQAADRFFPWGWTPGCDNPEGEKKLDYFFAGQDTHRRRAECLRALDTCNGNAVVIRTRGFSQGLPHEMYVNVMASAKVVPCPSGPITVDSFRVCEALELGAIPIADTQSPVFHQYRHYWASVMGGTHPLPMVLEWSSLPDTMAYILEDWERLAPRYALWWQHRKKQWRQELLDDVEELRAG
jgi:hypothetical protein